MEQFRTGEWVRVSLSGLSSTQIVVCRNNGYLILANGVICSVKEAVRTKKRRMYRFPISRETVNYLRVGWSTSFDSIQPGMMLLVLVPLFGSDPKNYALAKLVVLAVKDLDRKVLYDQDGDLIDIKQTFYFGEKIESADGFLTEKGQCVLNQLYS